MADRIEFPTEVQPLAKELYAAALPQFQQTFDAGYQRPTTPLVTPFAPEEQEAMSGLSALARGPGAAPSYQFGQSLLEMGAAPIGQADISRLMSPYMSGVTEAAKRRAVEDFRRETLQPLMTQATAAGGLRGSRAGVERGLAMEGLGRTLSDIEAAGLQKAYEQAVTAATGEKGRMLTAATPYAELGTGAFGAEAQRYGTLAGVGETQRTLADALRQAELQQETEALQFPETTLARYLQFIGSPATLTTPAVAPAAEPARPSGIGNILGTGIQLFGSAPKAIEGIQSIGKFLGLFNQGGRVGGLSSIVRRANGGRIVRLQAGGLPTTEDQIKALQQASIKQATEAYLADALAEQQRKAAEKAALEKSWSYQLFGITDPAETALEAQRIGAAIMQPTEKTTGLGQAVEAITRGLGAKAEQDIEYEKQLTAKRAARQKTTQERLKSALDIAKEMRESNKSEIQPLIDLYTAESRTLSALAAQGGSGEQIKAMLPRLASLRESIFALTGQDINPNMNVPSPPPPSTGGSTPTLPRRSPAEAAAEAAKARATQAQAK